MANVRVTWVLPTTRESGKPLAVSDIQHVKLELSADEGTSFGAVGDFTPDVLETTVQDLDFGTWVFRATVVDTKGRVSQPALGTIVNEDTSPPSVVNLSLSF